ncbi:UNVERIFIED_CONTAM: hypothetical protein FKN15_042807 [Acipenser sinensis]
MKSMCKLSSCGKLHCLAGSRGLNTDWQQDDMLSLTASEVGKQELVFPSEDVESDSTSPAVKLSCRQSFYH